ncbi:MAG: DNA primase small subunit domain-containing protein, partial [Nitrososphaerota archaeon]|nr:DNA primase small subunit domain-containing protein [Nitrososphaerota archaeon]
GGMLRHKCFNNLKDFHEFVLKEVPLDIYVSAARYEDPGNRDMQEKKLIDAELFFDIDAQTKSLEEDESAWVCPKCRKYDIGIKEECPSCGSDVEYLETVNEEQLNDVLKETVKLVSILRNDFGIDNEYIHVFFSGNRGYHVHVNQEEFVNLTAEGRRELVDYLLIQGLEEKKLIDALKRKSIQSSSLKGVIGRVYQKVLEIMSSDKPGTMLTRNRLLKQIRQATEELKVRIDPVVTIDTHRLMRMPNSINSNSGMAKKAVRLQDLIYFNPLIDAVVLEEEEVTIKIKAAPRFKLCGKEFGPFKDEEVELPAYAAAYLICKGMGEYVGR